jgi:hypothetical protein
LAPHTRDEEAASTRGEKAACTKGEEGGTRAAARIGVVRRQRGERGAASESGKEKGGGEDCWWKSGPKGGRRHNSPLSSHPPFDYFR